MFRPMHRSIIHSTPKPYGYTEPPLVFRVRDGDGDGDKAPVTFTQEDVDRIVTRRLRGAQTAQDASDAKLAELTASFEEYKAANVVDEDKDKGADAEMRKLMRQFEQSQHQVTTLEAEKLAAVEGAAASKTQLDRYIIEQQAMKALLGANVLTTAAQHALVDFVRGAELETVDGKHSVIVKHGGVPYVDAGDGVELGKAATKYLADNAFYAKAPGGSGTPPPTGGAGGPPVQDFDSAPAGSLITAGLDTPVNK